MADQDIINLYSKNQTGGELPYFIGKQYGSGWLRTISRIAFPILRRLGLVAAKTVSDVVLKKQKILPSLQSNVRTAVGTVLPMVTDMLSGKRSAPPVKKSINKRKKHTIFKK